MTDWSVVDDRFLATPVGVNYLHEIDFIERELGDWFEVSPYRSRSQVLC